MVLPEGASPTESGRRAGWKLGGVVALAAIAIGLSLALLYATTPSPEAAEPAIDTTSTTEGLLAPTTSTTTTTIDVANFTIDVIATGERLSWIKAPTFVSGWPIALVAHDNRLWLFSATTTSGLNWGGEGLTSWVSSDGIHWTPAGVVASEEFSISAVRAVDGQLVALGSRLSDGMPHVWTSGDGLEWMMSGLSHDLVGEAPGYRTWLTGVADAGGRLHVIGFLEPNWNAEIIDRLPPEVAEHVIHDYGLGYTEGVDGERTVEVYGPIGILAYSATLSELGIDPDTASRVFESSHVDTSYHWSSGDGISWSQSKLSEMWVQDLAALPDGTLFLNGGDFRGNGIWASHDGSDWQRVPSRTQMQVIGSWGQSLLAISNDRDLVVSSNGDEWESLGTEEILPGRLYWQLHPVAAGERGLAVIASTWPETYSRLPDPVTIHEGGSSLTYDPTMGRVTVSDGDLTVSLTLWTGDATDVVQVDFSNAEVAFVHPESGDVVGRFSFDALHRAEATAFGPDTGEHALLLTAEGSEWSIIDLAEEIGSEARILMMEYLGDQLVMVTTNSIPWRPQEPVRFSVRVANLP